MTTIEAKQISLVEVLKKFGFEPIKQSQYRFVYASPFNPNEKTASFFVHPIQNVFTCFSTGLRGDVIRFVQEFKSVSFHQAMNVLDDIRKSSPFIEAAPNSFSFNGDSKAPKGIQILKVTDLKNNQLLDYLHTRKINTDIAKAHCKEIYHRVLDGKIYFSIAFPNDIGGFAARNAFMKYNIGKQGISTIKGENASCVQVFEGFMDFLSQLTIIQTVKPEFDTIVLNSVGALRNAVPELSKYNQIISYLDNDQSGANATDYLLFKFNTVNKSKDFLPYKDLNEYLMQCDVKGNHKGTTTVFH